MKEFRVEKIRHNVDITLVTGERMVGTMESGQMPLDQLLDSYRRGAELLAFCRSRLDAVDAQVKVLEGGQLKPWNEA